jgi:hypothetical protein
VLQALGGEEPNKKGYNVEGQRIMLTRFASKRWDRRRNMEMVGGDKTCSVGIYDAEKTKAMLLGGLGGEICYSEKYAEMLVQILTEEYANAGGLGGEKRHVDSRSGESGQGLEWGNVVGAAISRIVLFFRSVPM